MKSRLGGALFGRARTVVVVTGLAVLVWVLAESQTLQTSVTRTEFSLASSGDGESYAARIAPDQTWDGVVDVELRAPAAARGEAEQSLRDALVRIEAGRDYPTTPGTHVVDLREVVRRAGVVRGSGVATASCEPATVRVEVVRLVAVEVPVTPVLPEALRENPASAEPASVTLTVPEASLADVDRSALVAAAHPDSNRFGTLVPGQRLGLSGVTVALPEAFGDWAWASRVEPRTVRVQLDVRSVTAEHTIDRLPVQVLVAPGEAGRWRIDLPAASRDLVGVKVSGPESAIAAIATGDVRPIAVVRLSFAELEGEIDAKEAEVLGLPGGVSWEADSATIELSITRVEDAGGAG